MLKRLNVQDCVRNKLTALTYVSVSIRMAHANRQESAVKVFPQERAWIVNSGSIQLIVSQIWKHHQLHLLAGFSK